MYDLSTWIRKALTRPESSESSNASKIMRPIFFAFLFCSCPLSFTPLEMRNFSISGQSLAYERTVEPFFDCKSVSAPCVMIQRTKLK